jgi:glycosyl transferase, family 25
MASSSLLNSGQHLLKFFKQIYVINLIERPDRKQEITNQLLSIGLDIDKLSNIHFLQASIPESSDEFESNGAKGCFLSHLTVLKMAKETHLERVLVLEDDVNFANNLNNIIGDVLQKLSSIEWDIFYGDCKDHAELFANKNQLVKAEPSQTITRAHFIAFQGNTISHLIAFLESILTKKAGDPTGGPMHVDGAFSFYRNLHPECKTYVSNVSLGYQRSSKSNITPSFRHAVKNKFDKIIKLASDNLNLF